MYLVNAPGLSSENQQYKSLRLLRNLSNITLALNVFALGTSSHVFVLRYALKNGLERKNYAQFFALVPDVDISIQNTFHEKVTIKEDIRYLCSIHYFTDCGTRDENE